MREPLFLPHSPTPSQESQGLPLSQSQASLPPPQRLPSTTSTPAATQTQNGRTHTETQTSQGSALTASQTPTQTQGPRRPKRTRHFSTVEELEPKRHGSEEDKPSDAIVGVLLGEVNGEKVRIVITMDQIILIGRSPANDLVLNYPQVSRRHLRLTPVRTSSPLTTVTVSDLSTYGFYLNDVFHRPDRIAKVEEKRIRCSTYILTERDKIRLPGCPAVFTFHQGPSHSNQPQGPLELFKNPTERLLLGNFWVVHNFQLGDGSFGVVNLASHRQAAWFQVACKTVKLDDQGDRVRHHNEVKLLKRMAHPNVNGIIDLINDVEHNRSHMILELMAGGDLFAYQDKHGGLPEKEVQWIAWQLVKGLGYLHDMNVAHRDIKPENILLAVSAMYPRVVICDFGHSVDYDGVLSKTPKSEYEAAVRHIPHVGTASYIAPERLKMWLRPPGKLSGWGEDLPAVRAKDGKKGMTRRERLAFMWLEEEKKIDSWSLGVTLYVTSTRDHPYEHDVIEHDVGAPSLGREFTGRALTSAQSWAAFRHGTGNTSALGRTFLDPVEGEKLKRLLERSQFAKYKVASDALGDFSKSGRDFLASLLEPQRTKRLMMDAAVSHPWFKDNQKMLDGLYAAVVENGRVLHPDTAQALMNTEEVALPSQSQASRMPNHAGCATLESFERTVVQTDEIEEVEDSMRTNDEIEVDETEVLESF